jgi:hypothetical protein
MQQMSCAAHVPVKLTLQLLQSRIIAHDGLNHLPDLQATPLHLCNLIMNDSTPSGKEFLEPLILEGCHMSIHLAGQLLQAT